MANGKGSALAIIALIIGAGGLGLGIYSMLIPESNEGPETNLLAVWESLSGSGDDFNITFNDNNANQSEFFTLTEANTSIALTQRGWYRFTFNFLIGGLAAGEWYQFDLLKNGIWEAALFYIEDPQNNYWTVTSILTVFSDGDDTFTFRFVSMGDIFGVYSATQVYNQATLEFLEGI